MKNFEVTEGPGKLRTITTTNVSWLLASGWMFYFCSLLLNLVYYLMHPSSPEMWTWGREEKLQEWTPPEENEREERKDRDKLQGSQTELTELLPQGSDGEMQYIDDDDKADVQE